MIPLYFLSKMSKYWRICKKFGADSLDCGSNLVLDNILELTPKSTLLSLTNNYTVPYVI